MARRTAEQQILDLEAKIQSIKERAERKKVRANPAVKFMKAGLKSIEKAMQASDDAVIKKSLEEARLTLSSNLSLLGVRMKGSRRVLNSRPRAQANDELDADAVLTYVRNNGGQKGEAIAAEFKTDTATLRPVLRKLIDDGKVKTKGERRGTRYFAGA